MNFKVMKISVLSVIAVLLGGTLPVQSQVVFEETGIKAVFQKAREENKLVFMDCYTSWCGPCKKMLKEVFSRKDIGEYMNTRFVNYSKIWNRKRGRNCREIWSESISDFLYSGCSRRSQTQNGGRHDC